MSQAEAGLPGSLGRRGRFTGRRTELELLDHEIRRALTGEGRILVVRGEAGVGKTWLVEEALARGETPGRSPLVRRTRCSDNVGTPAYWPWRRLLHASVRLLEAPDGDDSVDAGSVPRVLANLALLLGRLDAAERHFHAAFRAIERSDARLEWAHLCRERAELRIAQGAHPEAEPVLDDLRRALALAREVGSRRVVNQIRATHPALVVEPTRGAEAARAGWFVQRGTTWSVGIGARPHELPDGRGLHFIAALLSRPGEEGPPTPGNAGTIGRR